MQVKVYKFTGLTSLLMSNIESVNRNLPLLKLGTKPNKGDIEKIAEGMTYRNEDGNLYMPAQALRSSLLAGCTGQKFPGSKMSPQKILQALIFPAEDRAVLLDKKNKPLKDIEIQVDSGVNKATKQRIIVVRARVPVWNVVAPFEIDEEFAPPNFDQFLDLITRMWNRAGRIAGIGAWRPENKGRHGKYEVTQQK